ncbi:TolC family protein [bacterium]|nr:TolC family protein [bacterium]
MKIIGLSSLIILVLFYSHSAALNLETAKQLALANNPAFKAEEHASESARWDAFKAYIGLAPSGQLSYNYSQNSGDYMSVFGGGSGGFGAIPFNIGDKTISYGINLSQPLFNGGKVLLGARIKSDASAIAQNSLYSARLRTINEAESKYLTVLEAIDLLAIARKSMDNSRQEAENGRLLFELGTLSKADYLQLQSQALTREVEAINAQNYVLISKLDLANFLQIDTDFELQPITLDDHQKKLEALAGLYPEEREDLINSLINIGLENNPNLQITRKNHEIMRKALWIARGNFLPSINLNYNRSWTKYPDQSDDYNDMETYSISASFPFFPLLDNLATSGVAINDFKESSYVLKNTEDAIVLAIKTSVLNWLTAGNEMKATKLAMEYSRESYLQMEERFYSGLISANEMLSVEIMYNSSQISYTRSFYNFLRAESALQGLLGIENESLLEFLTLSE